MQGEPVPEEEILLAFAQSEMYSRRWAQGLASHFEESIAERVRYSPREDWSEGDRQAVLDAVRAFRPPLLEPLLHLGVTWSSATLAPGELADLRVVATPELRSLGPDGRLGTLVSSLEKGRDTPDAEFSGGYRRMKNAYAAGRMHGRPCLVAKVPEGPYTIFEGIARLAVLRYRAESLKPIPDPLPVYLGVRIGSTSGASFPSRCRRERRPNRPMARNVPRPARRACRV